MHILRLKRHARGCASRTFYVNPTRSVHGWGTARLPEMRTAIKRDDENGDDFALWL